MTMGASDRPAPPAKSHAEIPVSDEMIQAGLERRGVAWLKNGNYVSRDLLVDVYRAMAAVPPADYSGIFPEEYCAVRRERDHLQYQVHALIAERDNALAVAAHHLAAIRDRDARIAELKSELSRRPAAFVDPEPEKLKHNPFREFGRDRRMVGR